MKKKIAIIFGGQSTEHQVSLLSFINVIKALNRELYEPLLIGVDKRGRWALYDEQKCLVNATDPKRISLAESDRLLALLPGAAESPFVEISNGKSLPRLDAVFPLIHGHPGEDGSLQGLLKLLGVPFVGSDVMASAICMDKDITKRLLRDAGIEIPAFVTLNRITKNSITFDNIVRELGLPLFVKPVGQGSSLGIKKAIHEASFQEAVEYAFTFDDRVIIETAITGREIECAVLGNDTPQASGCGEIQVDNGFYAYDTKYIDQGGARLIVPAVLEEQISTQIRKIALKAYQTLGCTGMARVDFFLSQSNKVLLNEVNTIPGFTSISMYPKLWQVIGLSYGELLSQLIELAIARHCVRK